MTEPRPWPTELLARVIKAMCPEGVCRVCGEPRRRITAELDQQRRSIAALISSQRKTLGLRRRDLVPVFIGHYKNEESVLAQISNWELSKNVPVPRDWNLLKERLEIVTAEFDELIEAESRWNDADYIGGVTKPRRTGDFMGSGSATKVDGGITRVNKQQGWTDCGHNDFRPGVVLDPFGDGTTGAVATALGRDGIEVGP